ncbi:MAG: DUF368 domain-containing protein [Oscillospiraceae bacterium]|jgi:putative membrane protein
MIYLYYILAGAVIGAANIIPGVSGGTMAVLFGIYDRLLDAISLNFKKLRKNFLFLLTIGLGLVIGILGFAKFMMFLYENYNVPTQFFFMGLILGSSPLVLRIATSTSSFRKINIIPFIICAGLLFLYSLLKQAEGVAQTALDFKLGIILFSATAISTIAMIIPGISGSIVMKALGQYDTIITAIDGIFKDGQLNMNNVIILIPVVIGAGAGLLVGAKVISTLLKKFHQGVYFAILGLILGSLFVIYPDGFRFDAMGFYSILCLLCGAVVSLSMGNMAKKESSGEQV